jgi:hypothetical protein
LLPLVTKAIAFDVNKTPTVPSQNLHFLVMLRLIQAMETTPSVNRSIRRHHISTPHIALGFTIQLCFQKIKTKKPKNQKIKKLHQSSHTEQANIFGA